VHVHCTTFWQRCFLSWDINVYFYFNRWDVKRSPYQLA
jgi:hypothetical protein